MNSLRPYAGTIDKIIKMEFTGCLDLGKKGVGIMEKSAALIERQPVRRSLKEQVGQITVYILAGVSIGLLGVVLLQAFLIGISSFQ